MATIGTLDGPLDTSDLGTVVMHEHVFNITAEIQIAHPGLNGWNPEMEVPKAQQTLRGLKEAGIDTLVALSPIGLGRSLGAPAPRSPPWFSVTSGRPGRLNGTSSPCSVSARRSTCRSRRCRIRWSTR
jgi:hypothetical protein